MDIRCIRFVCCGGKKLFPGLHTPPRRMFGTNNNNVQSKRIEVGREQFKAFPVYKYCFEPAIFHAIDHLFAGPPGIHRDGNAAHGSDGHKGK